MMRTMSVIDDGTPETAAAVERLRASGAHVTVWPGESASAPGTGVLYLGDTVEFKPGDLGTVVEVEVPCTFGLGARVLFEGECRPIKMDYRGLTKRARR